MKTVKDPAALNKLALKTGKGEDVNPIIIAGRAIILITNLAWLPWQNSRLAL